MYRSRRMALIVSIAVAVASCANGPLPVAEWESRWAETTALVTAARDAAITEAECGRTLSQLREVRPDLSPPPIEDLEVPVDQWFDEAEDVFFECEFSDSETISRAFRTLETLRAEVETVLSLEG